MKENKSLLRIRWGDLSHLGKRRKEFAVSKGRRPDEVNREMHEPRGRISCKANQRTESARRDDSADDWGVHPIEEPDHTTDNPQ
jgi:hypothetical protein